MVHPQGDVAQQGDSAGVSAHVADAVTHYQVLSDLEAKHLALMAEHNLLDEWTPEVRSIVLAARDTVCEAREARESLRGQVRGLVTAMRTRGESLPTALRLTRAMLDVLAPDGTIRRDDGRLEAEVVEWVIEAYDGVS